MEGSLRGVGLDSSACRTVADSLGRLSGDATLGKLRRVLLTFGGVLVNYIDFGETSCFPTCRDPGRCRSHLRHLLAPLRPSACWSCRPLASTTRTGCAWDRINAAEVDSKLVHLHIF